MLESFCFLILSFTFWAVHFKFYLDAQHDAWRITRGYRVSMYVRDFGKLGMNLWKLP